MSLACHMVALGALGLSTPPAPLMSVQDGPLVPEVSRANAAVSGAEVAPQVSEVATFTLAESHETGKARVVLADITACSGSPRICEEAYGVDLGPSPEPGRWRFLHAEGVRNLLAKEWPDAQLTLVAPKPLKLIATGMPIDDSTVFMVLRDHLQQGVTTPSLQLELERAQVQGNLVVRPGDYRIEFAELTDEVLAEADWVRRNLSGHRRLEARLMPADEALTVFTPVNFTVSATFSLKEKLPVAARNLLRGETLTTADVSERWVTVDRRTSTVAQELTGLYGRRLRRSIAVGTPIPLAALEVADVVRRGQFVRLNVRGRGLAVSGRVKMLGSGGPGDTVDALYPTTRKRLRVKVIDQDTVEYLY